MECLKQRKRFLKKSSNNRFLFFVILSLFSYRGQPFFLKYVIFISCFTMRRKELQKYAMLDRKKIAEKETRKNPHGSFLAS